MAYAAIPWARIKGAQPTRHAFQYHYVDWFHPAIEWFQYHLS